MFDQNDCLVSFRTAQSVKLRILFESLHAILGEAQIDFTPEGVFLQAITSQGMVIVNLFKDNIDEYICTQPTTCGIKFSSMYSYLKNVTDTDVVAIQVTKSGFDGASGIGSSCMYLFVSNDGQKEKCSAYHCMYQIRLLWIQPPEILLPEALYMDTCVTLPSATFQRFLRSHEKVDSSPDVTLQVLAHVPGPDADGNPPAEGQVFFVSVGAEAHLTTSSAFPLNRATDDPTDAFAPQFAVSEQEVADTINEAGVLTAIPPVAAAPLLPPPALPPGEDCVRFMCDPRFADKQTSIIYGHRSCDKLDLFSLKFLLDVAKMTNMSHYVRLFLTPVAPLMIMYDVGTLGVVLVVVNARSNQADPKDCSLATLLHTGRVERALPAAPAPRMTLVAKSDFERKTGKNADPAVPGQKRARKPGSGRPRKKPLLEMTPSAEPAAVKKPSKPPKKKKATAVVAMDSSDESGGSGDDDAGSVADADVFMARAHGL